MLSKSFNSKRVFKEKIVQLYINIIKKEEPCSNNQNFWDEFFLLKANGNALEQELKKLENNAELKAIANLIFSRSLIAIRDSNQLRVLNGLITLCSLTHCVLHGLKPTLNQDERIDILIGKDDFDQIFGEFVEFICDILFLYDHNGIKGIVLKLLLIIASADLDVNNNIFFDYLMSDHIFDALIHLLNTHQQDGCKILLLLVIFLNYKKSSINNPYVMKLSIVDNEMILSGYSQVISNELIQFNQKFDLELADSRSGIFSTLSNMVGTIFSGDDNSVDISAVMGKKASLHKIKTALLAFYDAVLLNRNFISLLTTSLPDSSSIKKDSLDSGYLSNELPPNLFVAFLEFTSVIMLDMKDEATLQTTRLCFVIMTCITEDSCANSIIHDNNAAFVVNLQRMPMRHRKVSIVKSKGIRPISHAILDLMTEFILSHMNRNLQNHQYGLFQLCLSIIHRLLSFQKKCRVRIDYCWKELWSALILLIKFFINNESYFVKHQIDIFAMCHHIINLFNLFIMYGDNFLATTNHYDELYYEIIRTYTVFDNLNSLALHHMTKESNGFKESATKLTHSLINVKAIIAHFNAKIEAYSSQNQIVTLSEEQVLEVVRNNYDSLTLKVQDNIDQFEPYDPSKPNESEFLMKLLSSIGEEYSNSKTLAVSLEEQQQNYTFILNRQAILAQDIATSSALITTTTTFPNQESSTNVALESQ